MKASEIINILEKYAPLSKQEEWDKCGVQIGDVNQNVSKVMISLNADIQTIDEAIEKNCQMLITHHPFLLDTIETIEPDNFLGEFIYKAIKNDIVVYSSHTALDSTLMNEWLICLLGVDDVQVGDETGITRIAKLKKPLEKDAFINMVKDVYHLEHFKYAGTKDIIQTVAVCGGSGADFLPYFYNKADAYITGDTKYHHAKNAVDHNILLVDVNHHVENIMVSHLKDLLEKEVDVEIVEGSSPDYYHYI